tara:strand:- start:919 stop:1515 length:597 start_codon:yes stop_codon:yes gene_type:complete
MFDLAHKKSAYKGRSLILSEKKSADEEKLPMIRVYLANRPPLAEYLDVDVIDHLPVGEIQRIASETGNHWRKIFNVYAKLIYSLAGMAHHSLLQQYGSWQEYRDQSLLQQGSDTELYLDPPSLSLGLKSGVHVVMGKSFSERLLVDISLEWLDNDFAINRKQNIIVSPYFDYRQLSNIKIERLAELIVSLQNAVVLRH